MASIHSFYLLPTLWSAPFVLTGDEAHHLVRVLRLKAGARVRLFDGCGKSGFFTVESASKNEVRLALKEESFTPGPNPRCTLAACFSKALRRGWFMEKAVELEAHSLVFWQGDYSQASLPASEKDSWKASLIAGAKQCENPRLPELSMLHGGVEALCAERKNYDRAYVLYEGDTQGRLLNREDLAEPGDLLLVVGPEGGFSPREISLLLSSGFTAVSLGARVLRWETAAVLTLGLAWHARQR